MDHQTHRRATRQAPSTPSESGSFTQMPPLPQPPRLGRATVQLPASPPPRQALPAHNNFNQLFGGPLGEEDDDKGWDSNWGFCMPTQDPCPPTTQATRPVLPQLIPHTLVQSRATPEKEARGITPAMAAASNRRAGCSSAPQHTPHGASRGAASPDKCQPGQSYCIPNSDSTGFGCQEW